MGTTKEQAEFQQTHYWDTMVREMIDDCMTILVQRPSEISGWLAYILELCDVMLGNNSQEVVSILNKMKATIERRLEQGEW